MWKWCMKTTISYHFINTLKISYVGKSKVWFQHSGVLHLSHLSTLQSYYSHQNVQECIQSCLCSFWFQLLEFWYKTCLLIQEFRNVRDFRARWQRVSMIFFGQCSLSGVLDPLLAQRSLDLSFEGIYWLFIYVLTLVHEFLDFLSSGIQDKVSITSHFKRFLPQELVWGEGSGQNHCLSTGPQLRCVQLWAPNLK